MSLYLGDIPIANDGLQRLTGEIGDIGIAPLGIDESLNLRRYLNGQVISQLQFEAFTAKVKSAVALYPSLATTEDNWQAEKALSKFGQVGKFVIDDENQTIRLPAVVNAQGLLGLTGIGGLVNESLPNITGNFGDGLLAKRASDTNNTAENINANGAFRGASVSNGAAATASITSTTWFANGRISLDASRSSAAYQDGAAVQQEAIQYPYYIQVATGIEETLPAIREYGINTPFFFGWSQYFENAPYNASLLASQGQYNASNLYPDLWTQLTGVELNGSLNVGDTIEISGKTYVKRGLPVKLSTDTYDDYDFVVNMDDQTFRLPLLKGSEDLPASSDKAIVLKALTSGGTVSETAPKNGWAYASGPSTGNGYFTVTRQKGTASQIIEGDTGATFTTSSSIKSTIFVKKGDTIYAYASGAMSGNLYFIPAVGNGTLYFYVGDVVQDASLINAGAVLSDVVDLKQNKLDREGNHTVVETYKNGASWYRVWSDGWVEQGGQISSGAWTKVTLLKPFTDTNYNVTCGAVEIDMDNALCAVAIYSKTADSFYLGQYYNERAYGYPMWRACGY